MQTLKEIKKEKIRDKVISQIRKAKKEILATMDIAEELRHPLPIKYFSLLHKKHKEGIKIKRIIFSSIMQYKSFIDKMRDQNLFFIGKHTKSKNYKRMILIDRTQLFFQKKIKGKEKFYFTTDNKYLKKYKAYFNRLK